MPKSIPQRQCVGCREKKLGRSSSGWCAQSPDGGILARCARQGSGRGAYLCPNPECLKRRRRTARARARSTCRSRRRRRAARSGTGGARRRIKAANYLGLMRKAGAHRAREHDAGAAARAGKACLLLLVQDASDNARKREGFAGAGRRCACRIRSRRCPTGSARPAAPSQRSPIRVWRRPVSALRRRIRSNTAKHGGSTCRKDENRQGRGAAKRRAPWQEEETSMSGLIKYRVHEVAKDFNMTSKEITQILTDYATTPKNHMQVLRTQSSTTSF